MSDRRIYSIHVGNSQDMWGGCHLEKGVNQTKIKGGCQSGVVPHDSKSDLGTVRALAITAVIICFFLYSG